MPKFSHSIIQSKFLYMFWSGLFWKIGYKNDDVVIKSYPSRHTYEVTQRTRCTAALSVASHSRGILTWRFTSGFTLATSRTSATSAERSVRR